MTTEQGRSVQLAYGLRHLLNGEWIADVLIALSGGPLRYHRLLSTINARCAYDEWAEPPRQLQEAQLARTLFRMEGSGLLARQEGEEAGARVVVFALTGPAEQLFGRCQPLLSWAEQHSGLVERHQRTRAQDRGRSRVVVEPGAENGGARRLPAIT